MRIPLFYQVFFLSLATLAVSALGGYVNYSKATQVLFEHEDVDLRDESQVLATEFTNIILTGVQRAHELESRLRQDSQRRSSSEPSEAMDISMKTLGAFFTDTRAADRDANNRDNRRDGVVVEIHYWIAQTGTLQKVRGTETGAEMPPLEEGDSLPESSIQVIDPHLVVTTRFNIDQATCAIRLYIDIPEFRWRLEKSPRHEGMLLDDQQRRLLGSWTQQDWNLLKDSGQGSAPPPSSLRPGQSPKSPAPEPAPEPMRPSLSPVPLAITLDSRRPEHWFCVLPRASLNEAKFSEAVRKREQYDGAKSADYKTIRYTRMEQHTQRVVFAARKKEELSQWLKELGHSTNPFTGIPLLSTRTLHSWSFPVPLPALGQSSGEAKAAASRRWFTLVRAASAEEMRADIEREMRHAASVAVGLSLAIAIALSWLGNLLIVMPLNSLKEAVKKKDAKIDSHRTFSREVSDLAMEFEKRLELNRQQREQLEQREVELKRSERLTRCIVESAAEAIITVDPDERIVDFNSAAERMFGVSAATVRGTPIAGYLSLNASESATPFRTGELAASGRPTIELWARDSGAKQFRAEVSANLVAESGPVRFAIFIRDITERARQREDLERQVKERTLALEISNAQLTKSKLELQQNQRLREMFIGQINHDIRNPLQIIGGCLRRLRRAKAPEQFVAELEQAGGRIHRLVDDLRDYQVIVNGAAEPRLREFDPRDLFDEIKREFATKAEANRVALSFSVADDVPLMLSDRDWLLRIVANLVGNACKFTRDGSICCRMWLDKDASGRAICIEVSDTGRGMSPEEQARLFVPYEKIASVDENPDGTGLGLVICKEYCKRLQGGIEVVPERTRLGKGTTFLVKVAARLAPGTPRPTVERAADSHSDRERPLALVVDDEVEICRLIGEHLSKLSFDVIFAHNGLKAVELARERLPDLVTLDIQIPLLDGWHVLRDLKATAATKSIPVVLITVQDNLTKGFTLGAADFLGKPIDFDHFEQVVSRFCPVPNEGSILLVDDELELRQSLTAELTTRGWRVIDAADGVEALERLRAGFRPDVVLLDLLMPRMNGFEFARVVREDSRLRDIPIIVLTGQHLTPADRDRFGGCVQRIIEKQSLAWSDLLEQISAAAQRIRTKQNR